MGVAAGQPGSGQWQWSSLGWDSFSAYTKVKSSLKGLWQEESGLTVRFATAGRLRLDGNVGWLVRYPVRSPIPAQWNSGVTAAYRLGPGPRMPSVFVKLRDNLQGKNQGEAGLSDQFGAVGPVRLSANIGYIVGFPYHRHSAPVWTSGITFAIPFRP